MTTPLRRSNALVVALALAVAACGDAPAPSGPIEPAPAEAVAVGWSPTTRPPLGPRYGSTAVWTGREVIVVGGRADDPCPPNADCAIPPEGALADGAAYDPGTNQWRPIAPAPIRIDGAFGAVAGGTLFLLVPSRGAAGPEFLGYDIAADTWSRLAAPAGLDVFAGLVPLGTGVVAVPGTDELGLVADQRFDVDTGTWIPLPDDPLGPSFDRSMVAIDDGLVLFAAELVPQPGSAEPSLTQAATLDAGQEMWSGLPESPVLSGWGPWILAGGVIVNASIGTSDGGEVDGWGRDVPHGGILDPAAGAWRLLPDPPVGIGPYPGLAVGGREWVVSPQGWVLHVPTGSWVPLAATPGPPADQVAATWAGDRLFVWGGVAWQGGINDPGRPRLLDTGWTWSPG